ncbi:MAG: hypothetical protein AAGA56_01975 [Myxococcota bacterium]
MSGRVHPRGSPLVPFFAVVGFFAALAVSAHAQPEAPPAPDPEAATPPPAPPAKAPSAPQPSEEPAAGSGDSSDPPPAPSEKAPEPPAPPVPEPSAEAEPEPLAPEREERRRRARQAALEELEPRPDTVDEDETDTLPWERRAEIGGHFAFVVRPLNNGLGNNTGVDYRPAPGFGVDIRVPIVSWLRFHAYFHDVHHGVDIPPGALSVTDPDTGALLGGDQPSIDPSATVEADAVNTFSFGAALAPTWNITDRFRGWLSVGIGWGRFEFNRFVLTEADGGTFDGSERDGVFLEVPVGLGIAYDIIDRWLLVSVESFVAPAFGQSGNAHEQFQVLNEEGTTRTVGPLAASELSLVQSVGLAIIL